MGLSTRLSSIAEQVDRRRVADIGCDHGKLVEYLFDNNAIDYAFVTDISLPSVQKAVKILGDKDRAFDWACGDGTQHITPQHNIEQGIIAGMGGINIVKILKNDSSNIKSWVLQPQNNEFYLKKYLIKNKYKIVCDFIVKDKNIYYNILKVEKTSRRHKYSQFNMYFGKDNFTQNKYFEGYLDYVQKKCEFIKNKAPFKVKRIVKKVLKYTNKARKEIK